MLPPVQPLHGKRAAMVTFSSYPADPRPRRAIDTLLSEGMSLDLICMADGKAPRRESIGPLTITRLPIRNRRGGKLAYAYQYSAFIGSAALILAARSLRSRYHLVHVHNMPDVLVFAALVPKALGAKVLLDLHDPMPELLTTIFDLPEESFGVRLMKRLERWSISFSHAVVTVNLAAKRLFAARGCRPEKIIVVMNSPDEELFPFCACRPQLSSDNATPPHFVVMYHGSLVERNGLDLAVDALAQVREIVPAVELRIFGRSTPFLERVMAEARQRGLETQVRYLGETRLEDLAHEIDGCDIGIIPNHRNAFTAMNMPTRIFEYLTRGKPVIAPRTPGIQDYFNPESLLFFEPGDAESLAGELIFAALHPAEAATTAQRGQEVYLRHRWTRERQTFTDAVHDLLKDNRASGILGSKTDVASESARPSQS